MNKEEKTLKNSELKTDSNSTLTKMYKDLSNAFNSNNIQTIWQLSRNLTKYHFRPKI